MASHWLLCMPRNLAHLTGLIAALTIGPSVYADGTATHRAEFQECDDLDGYPALDNVHPSQPESRGNVYFYYIADVQDCPGSSNVSVRHTVKNLHPSKPLKFSWEGTRVYHRGLQPGKTWGEPAFLPTYDESPLVSQISYGVSLDYTVAATIYPLPLLAPRASKDLIEEGEMLVNSYDTEYLDSNNIPQHVRVNINSLYADDGTTTYAFSKEPADLVLALGGLADTALGQLIAESLATEFGPLEEFISKDKLDELPSMFAKDQFLIIPTDPNGLNQIEIQQSPTQIAIIPVALLTADFEPVATNLGTVLIP